MHYQITHHTLFLLKFWGLVIVLKDRNFLKKHTITWKSTTGLPLLQLEREPDNPYDEHAIAVYVKTEFHFNKVGYIPSELTQFVNPCMDDPDFDVSIRHIRMRTVFQKIGFYITIDITRRGLWPDEVIKASQKVR